ncbi:MAG: hypothetical protein J6S60_06180 [Oscillospiraceae bacterium]|nr:hypothetical protein [Oscillospiraceae bacterium]
MRDIRLEELPLDLDGKRFLLRCNMNVLADVQELHGGMISEALNGGKPTKSILEWMAAMLNDYADEQGWPERYTVKSLGRKISLAMVKDLDVMGMVTRALVPPSADKSGSDTGEENTDPETSGN